MSGREASMPLRRPMSPYRVYLILETGMSFLLGITYATIMVYWVTSGRLNPPQLLLLGTVLELSGRSGAGSGSGVPGRGQPADQAAGNGRRHPSARGRASRRGRASSGSRGGSGHSCRPRSSRTITHW
jgi:hypothetical protein